MFAISTSIVKDRISAKDSSDTFLQDILDLTRTFEILKENESVYENLFEYPRKYFFLINPSTIPETHKATVKILKPVKILQKNDHLYTGG